MAGSVFELFAKLSLDSSGFEEGLKESGEHANTFGSKLKSVFSTAGKVAVASVTAVSTAAVAAGAALVRETGNIAAYGDNIDKMSQKMGMSAEAYQEWDAVLQHSGTSIESMQASMKTLATAAETGNEAFAALGITEEELATLNQEQLFERTISALQNMESDTERTYLAGKLLGRGATELGALLNTSAEDTQAMRDRVHELGGVMSDEAVKSAAAYQDSLQDMQTAFSGLSRGLLQEFLPGVTTVMDGLTEVFSGNGDSGIAIVSKGVNDLVTGISEKLPAFVDLGLQILEALINAIIDNLPTMLGAAGEIIGQLIAGLIRALPVLIAQAPEIVKAIVQGLINAWPEIKAAGLELGEKVWEGLKGIVESARSWGSDLIQNFIDGITARAKALWDTVTDLAQGLKDFLGFSEPKKGPLSNFSTYAPDMMELFAKGIRDNEHLITDAISSGFDVQAQISAAAAPAAGAAATGRVLNFAPTINVNGATGDHQGLAEMIAQELKQMLDREEAALA